MSKIRKRGGRLDFSYITDKHPDKVFVLMNNEGGRIAEAMYDGWTPWKDEDGINFERVIDFDRQTDIASKKGGVVRRPVGAGREEASIEAVLMCIDKDKFNEIKQQEYDFIRDKKVALKKGVPSGNKSDVEGLKHYAPNLDDGGKGYSEEYK